MKIQKKDVVLIIALVICLILVRLPFLKVPLERDEGEYAYCAWQWEQGGVPYRDIITSVTPGVFLLYSLAFKSFGYDVFGIRVFTLFFIIVALIFLYLYARRIMGRVGALSAALGFITLTVSQRTLSYMSQRELFLLLPMVMFAFLLHNALEKRMPVSFFLMGFLVGCMVMVKQTAIFTIFLVVGLLWWTYYRERSMSKDLSTRTIVLTGKRVIDAGLGFILVIIIFCVYFYARNSLEDFVFWNFTYPKIMSDSIRMSVKETFWLLLNRGVPNLWGYFSTLFPLNIVLAGGLIVGIIRRNTEHRFHMLWYAAMIAAVCAGWHFRGQYFQLLIVPQALLMGWGGDYLWELCKRPVKGNIFKIAFFILYLWVFLSPLLLIFKTYYGVTPEEISRKTYGPQAFFMAQPIARYIEKESIPGDTLYILGTEQEIYFYAKRKCATPFITMYSLTYSFGDPKKRQEIVAAALKNAPPRFILVINNFCSQYDMPHVTEEKLIFREVRELVKKQYFLDGFAAFTREKDWLVLGKNEVWKITGEKMDILGEIRFLSEKVQRYPDILIYRRKDAS